jgi:hypothetical protein
MTKKQFDMYAWRSNVWLRESKALREDDNLDPNDEADMAHTQLMTSIDACEQLSSLIKPGMQLDAWVQSKLTLAAEYLTTVADYMAAEQNK